MVGAGSESPLKGACSISAGIGREALPFRRLAPAPRRGRPAPSMRFLALAFGAADRRPSCGRQTAGAAAPPSSRWPERFARVDARADLRSLYSSSIRAAADSAENLAVRVQWRRARPCGRAGFLSARSARFPSEGAATQLSTSPASVKSRLQAFCSAELTRPLQHARLIYGNHRLGRTSANGKPFLHAVSVPSGCERPSPLTKHGP